DNNKNPMISIITTYYNTGPLIHETAQCIFHQTFQNFEWIIVNDGSSKSFTNELFIYNKTKNVKIIHLSNNIGLPGARNEGIKIANGQYFVFLDADDLIEP